MKEFLFQSGSILIQRERDIVLLSKSSSLHILDKVKLNLFPIIITLKSESKYKSQGGGGLTTKNTCKSLPKYPMSILCLCGV